MSRLAVRLEVADAQQASLLGRTSPLVKLGAAITWLLGLATTTDPRAPLLIAGVALAAGFLLGKVPLLRMLVRLAPLAGAALGIGLFNALFGAANHDPAQAELVRIGPLRVVDAAAVGGLALSLRVVAIAVTGVVFALTTDPTRLFDALVQQAHVSDRFAYGTLAAYQAIPRFAEDLVTLRQARRIRGLPGSWHPRILVGLLVLALRHGDRLALAMDARAFGLGPRSRFRTVSWSRLDPLVAGGALALLAVVLVAIR